MRSKNNKTEIRSDTEFVEDEFDTEVDDLDLEAFE